LRCRLRIFAFLRTSLSPTRGDSLVKGTLSEVDDYNVIQTKKIWKIVDKRNDYKLISLKWIFIYKFDFDDFFFKYKARIVIRDDLQKVNNAQNVYATTLCYVLVSSTNTSHLIIASFLSDQASLLDSLHKSSVNQTRRFNDHAQIFSKRIMKWAKDLNTRILINYLRRVSSRDIYFTTW
jgi:hypothetical protein